MNDRNESLHALLDDPRTQTVLPSLLERQGKGVEGKGTGPFLFGAVIDHGLGENDLGEVLQDLRVLALVRVGVAMLGELEPTTVVLDAIVGLLCPAQSDIASAMIPMMLGPTAEASIMRMNGTIVEQALDSAETRLRLAREIREASPWLG